MDFERYYEPTSEDLQEWALHLQETDYQDDYPTDEMLQNWNEANDYIHEEEDAEDEPDPGEMDGDHASALTSIGWGTDEDYGYYGDSEYDF